MPFIFGKKKKRTWSWKVWVRFQFFTHIFFSSEKLYSSEKVTKFLKDPEEEEDTFDNDMTMNRRPERETCYSECDSDVEITLKASGLQKSKPVIRTVKKALRGTL